MFKTTSRRVRLATIIGAVLALGGIIAVPTAASAAEVQNCVTVPTPETQPWQTFVDGGNIFDVLPPVFTNFVAEVQAQVDTIGPLTTQDELDAVSGSLSASVQALTTSFADVSLEDSLTALRDGLLAADPANEATWTATLDGILDQLGQQSASLDFNTAFETYITLVTTFLDDTQDALDAAPPTAPGTVPAAVATSGAALVLIITQLAQAAQIHLYDAAAAQVVLAQVCTTIVADVPIEAAEPAAPTLANTGSSDGPLLGTIAALLLLAGATASVLVARRRRAH